MELDEFIKTLHERKKKSAVKTDVDISLGAAPSEPQAVAAAQVFPAQVPERPLPKNNSREALEQFKHRIHALLVGKLDPEELKGLTEENQRTELRRVLDTMIDAEKYPLGFQQKQALIAALLDCSAIPP